MPNDGRVSVRQSDVGRPDGLAHFSPVRRCRSWPGRRLRQDFARAPSAMARARIADRAILRDHRRIHPERRRPWLRSNK